MRDAKEASSEPEDGSVFLRLVVRLVGRLGVFV